MALAALEERPSTKSELRWRIAAANAPQAAELANRSGHSPLLAQCALNRGWGAPEVLSRNLAPKLKNLADPFRLPGMREAVERLWLARERKERVVLFGDYDVDGITACAALEENLVRAGFNIRSCIPHRMEEGYGLSEAAVARCLEEFSPALLVAVDCGSSSAAVISALQSSGVDVIVLDHHQIGDPVPSPNAFINPRLSGEFVELCSVGLAFKLCHALVKRARELGVQSSADHDIRPSLDLAALGTIADQVPLTGENRILVQAGLERLNRRTRAGIKALAEVAQTEGEIGAREVGFQLAPRLNAAGRLESARAALELLLETDDGKCRQLASQVDEQNRRRQEIERRIAEEAIAAVRAKFDPARDYAIVEGAGAWHIGVVGIVASRVLKEFYRPTIILGGDSAEWRGSGRSIEGFDLAAGLRECAELLSRHGGHAMAAGLSIRAGNVDSFRARFNEVARAAIAPEALQPILTLDAEVKLSELTLEVARELEHLAPFGQGNPPVRLCARNLKVCSAVKLMGKEQQHARFWVTDGSAQAQVVWWNCGKESAVQELFDMAFEPQINVYKDRESLQLKLLDWKPARSPAP